MQKKIIAACLVILMLSTLLASCGKKYIMMEINGVERPLVTDAEGNTEVDEEGKIAVYVTDASGNIKLDGEGNPQKNYFSLPDKTVDGLTLKTKAYTFTMPKGWDLNENGTYYKKGTNDKCYVNVELTKAQDDYESFEMLMNENYNTNQQFMEAAKEKYPNSVMNADTYVLADQREAYYFEYIIKDADGNVVHYAMNVYSLVKGDIYSANYICTDGVGYDETFDFKSIVSNNFIVNT